MANRSIEFKIGADTTDFLKNIKKSEREVNNLKRSGTALTKGLSIKFDNSDFLQAQKQVQSALDKTTDRATEIRKELKYLESTGDVDSTGYSKLQLELAKTNTKAKELKVQLDNLNKIKFEKLASSFTKAGTSLTKAGNSMKGLSVAAAAAVAGLVKITTAAAQNADDINTLSAQYNLSTESIQKWTYVAEQSGITSDQLFKATNKLNDALGTQLSGSADMSTKALDALGISAADYGNDTDAALMATIEALAGIESATEKASLANDIFGTRMGANIIAVSNQGTEAISNFVSEFEEVGYLSDDQLTSLNGFNNTLKTLKTEFTLASEKIAVAFLPIMEDVAEFIETSIVPALERFAEWLSSLSTQQEGFILGTLAALAALAPLLIIIGKMATGIGAIIKLMPTLIAFTKSLNLQTAITAAGFASLAAGLALSLDLFNNWSKMSTVEKILKGLAVAALAAAAAIMVFHASWSLGLAIGGIVAGIAAGAAALHATSQEFGLDSTEADSNFSAGTASTSSVGSSESSSTEAASVNTASSITSSTDSSTTNSSNDTYNITVNVADTNASATDIAKAVALEMAIKVQSRS